MSEFDIFVSSMSIITLDHMKSLKNSTLDGNTGHFDNVIDLAGPGEQSGVCPYGEVRGVSVRLPMVHFSHGQLHLSSGDRPHSSRSVGSWVSSHWIVDDINDPVSDRY